MESNDNFQSINLLPEQIKNVEELEKNYEKLFSQYPNSYETGDAYMKWYGEAEVLFQRYFNNGDHDLVQFCSVVNEGIGSKLRDNRHKVYPHYRLLLDRLKEAVEKGEEPSGSSEKKPKVFISHSSEDVALAEELVTLFEFIGVKGKENLLCTSVNGYRIPLGADFIQYLHEQFTQYKLFVIFLHTDNYYHSDICLNEMGAAWALKTEYYSVLSADFDFSGMEGVVSNHEIAVKIGASDCSSRLNALKDNLVSFFGLPQPDQDRWDDVKQHFIERASKYKTKKTKDIIAVDNKPEAKEQKISTLQSLSSMMRLRLVEEGYYQCQVDVKFGATEDVYMKDVFLCNEKLIDYDNDMLNALDSQIRFPRCLKSTALDIQSVNKEQFLNAVDAMYEKESISIVDHYLAKGVLQTVSFHQPITLKRGMDGYEDLPSEGWYLFITYNFNGELVIPLKVTMVK